MGRLKYFHFFPDDWLSSTKVNSMSLAEQGAYLRLLCHAWTAQDGGVPKDEESLARLSGLGDEGWSKGASRVLRCFDVEKDGRLFNVRLLQEVTKQEEWLERSRYGGVNSGKSRRIKALGDVAVEQAVAEALKGGRSTLEAPFKHPSKGGSSTLPSTLPSKSEQGDTETVVDCFNDFLKKYPRQEKLDECCRCYISVIDSPEKHAQLMAGLERWLASDQWNRDGGRFVPTPSRFIMQKLYIDNPAPARASGRTASALEEAQGRLKGR